MRFWMFLTVLLIPGGLIALFTVFFTLHGKERDKFRDNPDPAVRERILCFRILSIVVGAMLVCFVAVLIVFAYQATKDISFM